MVIRKNRILLSFLSKGTEKIAQKVGEEAVEIVISAIKGHRKEVIAEKPFLLPRAGLVGGYGDQANGSGREIERPQGRFWVG